MIIKSIYNGIYFLAQATIIYYRLSHIINSIRHTTVMLQPKGFCYFSKTMVSLVLSQIHSQLSGPILGASPFPGLVNLPIGNTIVIANHCYNPGNCRP